MENGERIDEPFSFSTGESRSVRFQSSQAEIYAVMDGEVIVVFEKGDFKSIAIQNEDTIAHSYAWLDEIRIEKGQYIQQGDVIGTAKPINDSLFQIDVEFYHISQIFNFQSVTLLSKKEFYFECE